MQPIQRSVSIACLLLSAVASCTGSVPGTDVDGEQVLTEGERQRARGVPAHAAAHFETSYGETFLGGINLMVGPGEYTRIGITAHSDTGRSLHGEFVSSTSGFEVVPRADGSIVIQHDFLSDDPQAWLLANVGTILLSPPEDGVPPISSLRKIDLRIDADSLVAGHFEIHHVTVSESGTEVVETWRITASGRLTLGCMTERDGAIVLDPLMENPACRTFAR